MLVVIKKSIIIRCLFWGVIFLIWVGVIDVTLRNKGYQPSSDRSFTDEEMIRIAVQRAIQRMQAEPSQVIRIFSDDGSTYESFRPAFVVPYRDADHLLEENPKCCYIKPYWDVGGGYVTVRAKVLYKDPSGEIHRSDSSMFSGDFFPNSIREMP